LQLKKLTQQFSLKKFTGPQFYRVKFIGRSTRKSRPDSSYVQNGIAQYRISERDVLMT